MAFTDTFTDTSGTQLENHTPSGGTAWALGAGAAGAALIGPLGDDLRARTTTASYYTCDDQGSADHYVQARLKTLTTLIPNAYVACRIVDASNFVGWRCAGTGASGLRLCEVVGNTVTDKYSFQGVDESVYRVEVEGTTARIYADGVQKGPNQTIRSSTETSQGLRVASDYTGGGWIDDFEAGALGGGTAHNLEGAAAVQATATGNLTVPADVSLAGAAAAAAISEGTLARNGFFAESSFAYADSTNLASVSNGEWTATALLGTGALGVLGQKAYGPSLGSQSLHIHLDHSGVFDYSVSIDITAGAADLGGSTNVAGVAGRYESGAAFYYAGYYGTDGTIRLYKYVLFEGSTLLGTYSMGLVLNQTVNLRLEMIGSAIAVYVDDVQRISVTDTAVTVGRHGGVYGYTAATDAWTMDSFKGILLADAGVNALAGVATTQAAASAALSVSVPLAAAGLSVSTTTGALSISLPLAGAATATPNATGGLSLSVPLSGSAVAQALASAGITVAKPLSGSAIAEALASAALGVSSNLSGAAVAEAVAAAALSQGVTLSGAAIALAVASADLAGGINLSGAATAEALAAAGLALSKALAGSAAASASATGGLSINLSLSGQAIAEAAASAALTTLSGASLAGSAAASASAAGGLTHAVPLSGASLAVSSASGNLTQLVPLSGSAASASMATGGLDVQVQLLGAALAQALAAAGLTHIINAGLSGAAFGDATAQGSVTLRVNLDGVAVASAIAAGALSAQGLMTAASKGWTIAVVPRNWTIEQPARNWTIEQPARNWRVQR